MSIASIIPKGVFIKQGYSGPQVKQIQLALAKLGYPLSGTGYFGPATDTAVEAFQRKAGLRVDGEVGPTTASAIDAALGGVAPALVPTPARAETARPLWLEYSIAHIGTREAPGAADNRELVADIKTVAPDYQHDSTPWCAGWVSLCLAKAGEKPSQSPLWARSYSEGWGVKLLGPAVGAIAVKTRTGGGHVTFVAGRNRNGILACCGGNQNDMVNISEYAASAFNLGFFWPKDVPLPRSGISALPIVTASGKVTSEA